MKGGDRAVWELQLVPNRVLQPHYAAGKTPPVGKSENLTNTTKHPQTTWNDLKWIRLCMGGPFGIIPRGLGVFGGVCEIFTFYSGWCLAYYAVGS